MNEEEADKLPQGVHAKAAWHHRIAHEMAGKEPEVGVQVEFRNDLALGVRAATVVNVDNAVAH